MCKVVVVTGSNKGIGLAIVKGLCQRLGNNGTVYLTSRNKQRGTVAVEQLGKEGFKPEYHQLDVTNKNSVIKFADHLREKHGGIDILINNAAIPCPLTGETYDVSVNVIDTNYKSILTMEEIIYPLVRSGGRILNISSDCGHLSNIRNKYWIERLSNKNLTMDDVNEFVNWFLESKKNGTFNTEDIADDATASAYRIAKVALSAATIIQHKKYESKNISINSMHPGLVRTDITGGVGFYSIDQAAETPLYIVLDAPETLKGAYVWYDRKVLDWYDYKADYYFKSSILKK